MTEKRYTYHKSEITGLFVISDEKHRETFSGMEEEYNCMRIVHKLNTLTDENEQLKKQIKIFDLFLEGNNLDIDWNELCILDSCMMNDEVECRDCIYMGRDVLE